MPEPVEFLLDGNTRLMLVPADGFQWVIGENSVAENGVSDTVLGVGVRTMQASICVHPVSCSATARRDG
jgi:hypothetical protein